MKQRQRTPTPKKIVIPINFDPTKAGQTVQRIFHDKACRTLWLLWKRTHIVGQHFDDDVLTIGIKMGCLNTPMANPNKVKCFFFPNQGDFTDLHVQAFITENIKYFDDSRLDFELVMYKVMVTTA